jgi:signal peptide peptidase SppA
MTELFSTKAWALESRFFDSVAPVVMHRLATGRDLSVLQASHTTPQVKAGESVQVSPSLFFDYENGYHAKDSDGSIMPLTRITGTIQKVGMCGPGTRAMGERLQLNDSKPHIKGHLLYIDSPGGAVDGTPEFGSIISSLEKPVVAYVDGMAASAAYWIASQADFIVANANNITEVGSIGTLCMLVNQSEWLKKEGIKLEIMRADKSKDKARLNAYEEWPEEELADLQEDLNEINQLFISNVTNGRAGKLRTGSEDIFTGKMYKKEKALEMGMVDKIGSMQDAINAVRNISLNRKSTILY